MSKKSSEPKTSQMRDYAELSKKLVLLVLQLLSNKNVHLVAIAQNMNRLQKSLLNIYKDKSILVELERKFGFDFFPVKQNGLACEVYLLGVNGMKGMSDFKNQTELSSALERDLNRELGFCVRKSFFFCDQLAERLVQVLRRHALINYFYSSVAEGHYLSNKECAELKKLQEDLLTKLFQITLNELKKNPDSFLEQLKEENAKGGSVEGVVEEHVETVRANPVTA